MKRKPKTTSKSNSQLPKNNSPLEKIPDNLLATISGGTLSDDEKPLFELVAGNVSAGTTVKIPVRIRHEP